MARPTNITYSDFTSSLQGPTGLGRLAQKALSTVFRRVVGRTVAADVSNATTTLANVTGLSFNVKKGKRYRVMGELLTAIGTQGLKAAVNITNQTSPTMFINFVHTSAVTTTTATQVTTNGGTSTGLASVLQVSIDGFVVPDANGVLTIQSAAFAAGTALTKQGSWASVIQS